MNYTQKISEIGDPQPISAGALFLSLGTFWTQMFNERGTLRGLTQGQAQESIQQYFALVEAVAAYSVKDCPVFALEKWLPMIITKSQYNKVPFVFEPNGATFGTQAETDQLYAGQVFQFGNPKTPRPNVFAFTPNTNFGQFGVMANRILTPSAVYTSGTEFYYSGGTVYFNFDIFNNPLFPKTALIGDNGTQATYIDQSGATQNDEFTVVWFYCAEIDRNILFDTYGRIFDINKTTSLEYKVLLEKLMYMHSDGPTVANITSVITSFCGEVPVQEQVEIVEDFFSDGHYNIVVTDCHVYKVPTTTALRSDMAVGLHLFSGEAVSNTVEYYDNVATPNWWKTQIVPSFAVGENVLLGNYQSQLGFSNSIELLTVDWNGNVHFPVTGSPQDVATFNAGLDQPKIKKAFGLSAGQVYALNPLDFLFDNFIKNNTAFLRLRISLDAQDTTVFTLHQFLKPYLPSHVWLLFSFEGKMPNELYNNFQNMVNIEFSGGPQMLNADGSNDSGVIERLAPFGYKDIKARLFAIGKGGPPGLETEGVKSNTDDPAFSFVDDGNVTTNYLSGLSTREVRRIQLLNFITEDSFLLLDDEGGGVLLDDGGFLAI